ncbi:MAG: AMP-binding enzyme, partial [Sphingopyxis sp.]
IRAIQAHPAVAEASVIGLADGRLGQVPAAAILLDASKPAPSVEQLKAFLRSSLSSYQLPVLFHFLPSLPRTASMKVDQRALREILQPLHDGAATSAPA